MFTDFPLILHWWFILFLFGWLSLPLTAKIFARFWDQGYALSKIFGLALVGYPVWLLASLKILPFIPETIWLIVIFAFVFNYFVIKNSLKIKNLKLKIFWLEELLFLICLMAWSFIRGFQPDIQGLEKFMDYGFMQSILKSDYFPPKDMWFAGGSINYYYFGHYISALLTNLSGLEPLITYNLMIATLFALSFSASFSLGSNLSKFATRNSKLIILSGFLAAFLVCLGGNLHALWYLLKHGNFQSYWYPDATRFIVKLFGAADNTIHEFPLYSFVVADLHGHVSNLPFVLVFLALLLAIVITPQKQSYNRHTMVMPSLTISLLLAVFYMTNTWDIPIYLAVLGLTFWLTTKSVFRSGLLTISYSLLAILLALPFILNFKSISGGPALTDFHSPLWMLLVLWGFPLLTTLIFLKTKPRSLTDCFVLILLAWSWFLVILPEFIYVKDIYIHDYQRANTIFKLTYQAFVMFALAESYIIIKVKLPLKLLCVGFLIFIFLYPVYAVRSYYGLQTYKGLYGLNFLKHYPDDYQALLWLKQNISGQPVILEAVGESYTDFGRVSTFTGLPTVLGWRVHEWLWRGGWDLPGQRSAEVQEIYESTDLAKTQALLKKYQVEYLFLGELERQQYPQLQLAKLLSLGQTVFSSGQTLIIRVTL